MIRTAFTAGLLAFTVAAQAQGPASAPVSAAKKELVAKVVQLQQGALEGFARNVVQQNALQVLQAAANAAQQRVAPDRREAVLRDMQADARKFAEETFPIVRDRAVKLGPAAFSPFLEERFTEDELKQLIALLESPVGKKYGQMNGEMMRSLGEKLMAEVKPLVEPKMQAYQKSIGQRLAPPATGAATAPK